MQLILDTENHSVNINEKMSTLNPETVLENTLPNGDLKVDEEINRKPESNGTSDKENVESQDNNVSKSDKFENLDEAGDLATVEKPKKALKQILECVPTEASTLVVEKENENDELKENIVSNAEKILDLDDTENLKFDDKESPLLNDEKKSESGDKEIQLNETKEPELDRTYNLEKDEIENLESEKTERLELVSTEKLKLDTTKNLEPKEAKKLKLDAIEKLEVDETEKHKPHGNENLEQNLVDALSAVETEKLEMNKMDKIELDNLKDLEHSKTVEPKKIEREELTCTKEKQLEINVSDVAEKPEHIPADIKLSAEIVHIVQENDNITEKADKIMSVEEKTDEMEVDESFNIDKELEDSSEKCVTQSISDMVENIVQNLNDDTADDMMDDIEEENSIDKSEAQVNIAKKINDGNVGRKLSDQDSKAQNKNDAPDNLSNCPKAKDVRNTPISQDDSFKGNETFVQTESNTDVEKDENIMEVDEEHNLNAITNTPENMKSADITKAYITKDIIQDTETQAKHKEAENAEIACNENNKEASSEISDELESSITSDINVDTPVKENNALSVNGNGDNIAQKIAIVPSIAMTKNQIDEIDSMENRSDVVELNSDDSAVNNLKDSESSITKVEDDIISCMPIEKVTETSKDVVSKKSDQNSIISNTDLSDTKDDISDVEEVKLVEVVNNVSEQKATDNTSKDVSEISDEKSEIPNADLSEKKDDSSDVEEVKLVVDSKNVSEQARNEKTPEKVTPLIKLSNTMDILSDEEEEPPVVEPPKTVTETSEKQCINLDDDDDIMLIDDDTNKDEKKERQDTEDAREKVEESKFKNNSETNIVDPKDAENKIPDAQAEPEKESTKSEINIKEVLSPQPESEKSPDTSEKPEKSRSLIPGDLFKSYRKNLTDMTRDDLEEFCILKIVESIIDRSNLNEIRSRLKSMGQTIEEYKKKAMMLTKQNRDLQVVLKSVQEEQKKSNGTQPITPLKITRSVGMQVLMTDKNRRRVMPGPGSAPVQTPPTVVINANQANNRNMRNNVQSPRNTPQKPVNNHPIPVPRLVPAGPNVVNKTAVAPGTPINNTVKPAPVQNGVKNISPAQKPEKRPHNRMQSQSSSVTVDLTDDEPPSKIATKSSPAPPVRLVNQQNLMAPRQQFSQQVNSPRKVYIPISINGSQTRTVTPGQTIMLKTVAQGPRPRAPAPPVVRPAQSVQVRRLGGARHPAPLPDAMKQYQPPNWKALPPAPDLKLSKVENGIVISWKIEGYQEDSYEEIASYQLYAYQETSAPPSTTLWKKIGDVKALPLPMACTLTQFMAGYKYYFAVRAVDIRSRFGPFSLPGSILLLNKM